MTDRELRKIRREELLEIMLKQEDELGQLREQLQEAEEKIKIREAELQKLSTIAEEALKVSGIFATAQAAADAYVEKMEKEASENQRTKFCREFQNQKAKLCTEFQNQKTRLCREFQNQSRKLYEGFQNQKTKLCREFRNQKRKIRRGL